MMNRLQIDRSTLPDALLPLAKEHLRVRFTRDDGLITSLVSDAIDAVERRCSLNLFRATYALRLDACRQQYRCDATDLMRYELPVNNVVAVTVTDGAAVDWSTFYEIEQADFGGAGAAWIVGPSMSGAGWMAEVDCGVDDPDDLAPAVRVAVLRLAAAYYEARESFVTVVDTDYLGELLSIWRPSV
jgi:uncharacterized phiE125 gp8 family phage protein